MKIIGLAGPARGGKDTAFKFIRKWGEELGLRVERDAFADRLKISAMRALGHPGDETAPMTEVEWANLLKSEGTITVTIPRHPSEEDGVPEHFTFSGREYLQWYGTEAHRQVFGEDFWTQSLFSSLVERLDYGLDTPNTIVVITDVRFDNEAQAVLDHGGEIWKINRPQAAGEGMSHASEAGIADSLASATINNDRSLEAFEHMVRVVCDGRLR